MIRSFETEEEVTNFALDWLRKKGASITMPEDRMEWLTPAEVRERYAPHLTTGGFHKRLTDAPAFTSLRSAGGRMLKLMPNPAMIVHLQKPKTPGRRTDIHGD